MSLSSIYSAVLELLSRKQTDRHQYKDTRNILLDKFPAKLLQQSNSTSEKYIDFVLEYSNNVTYFIITFLTGFRYGTGGRGWRVIQFKGGGVNATYPYGHPLPYLISKRVVGGGVG